MRYIIDGQYFTDKEQSFTYLQDTLELPPYMGHNLDGLWDVLLDKDYLEITLINGRLLLDNLGEYGRQFLDLLGDLNFEEDKEVIIYW